MAARSALAPRKLECLRRLKLDLFVFFVGSSCPS